MSNTLPDWRNFNLHTEEGQRQFDRFIGERLGFRIYHYDKDYKENCYYMLWSPDDIQWVGHDVRYWHEYRSEHFDWHAGECETEAEAWADMPHWSSNDRTSLTLCDVPGFILGRDEQGWFASFFGSYVLVADDVKHFSEKSHAIVWAWAEKWEKDALQQAAD